MSILDNELQIINRFVTINERQNYTTHWRNVVDTLIAKMCDKNSSFKQLYRGYILSGSYADSIKVSKPDEFDMVLRLRLPVNLANVLVSNDNDKPGYIKINVKKALDEMRQLTHTTTLMRDLLKMVDEDNYLIQNKVHSWIETILANCCNDLIRQNGRYVLRKDNNTYLIKCTKSGPAHTLNVQVEYSKVEFSVDLVPGMIFKRDEWISERKCPNEYNEHWGWVAIPKPDKTIPGKNNSSWIASHADVERTYIKDLNKLKNLIRLFKKIRDKQKINKFKSYYIKTVFLWETQNRDRSYWNRSLGEIFLEMFDVLLSYLEKKNLPSFWYKSYNLLSILTDAQISTIYNQFKQCRDAIKTSVEAKTPKEIIHQFLLPAEISELQRL